MYASKSLSMYSSIYFQPHTSHTMPGLASLIAKFMGPTWGPPGADRWAPCCPHAPCYLGCILPNRHLLEQSSRCIIYALSIAVLWLSISVAFFADMQHVVGGIFSPLRSGQNGQYFADDIFRCIFLNGNYCIFIQTSLKCIPKGKLTRNQHWCGKWLGTKQVTSYYLNQ